MTEEQKEKYANFLDKISEILGLNKPVDILRLCAVTDEYLRPIEKCITELEKENAELKVRLDMTTDIIKKLLEDVHIAENLFNFTSQSAIKAERFLEGLEK